MSQTTPPRGSTDPLDAAALVAALAGAAGSLALLLRAGRRSPLVVMVLMATWVVAPFIVLLLALVRASRWPALVRRTLSIATILLALASVAIYANDGLRPEGKPPAFLFVLLPPLSMVVIAASLGIAALIASRRGDVHP